MTALLTSSISVIQALAENPVAKTPSELEVMIFCPLDFCFATTIFIYPVSFA